MKFLSKKRPHAPSSASASASAGPPRPEEIFPIRRPLPLPAGYTDEGLRGVLESFTIDDSPPGALAAYLADSYWRFCHTFGLAHDLSGRALELGANPYFVSYLLREHTALTLDHANYFGVTSAEPMTQTVRCREADGSTREVEFQSRLFNLEDDDFPFGDATFDVVLFCEIIEHLLVDPTRPLREINRILAPGGRLILSTPNAARLENVLRLVHGEGTGDPYSANGPYGRHNREYVLHEIARLLRFCGFELEIAFTADGHPTDIGRFGLFEAVAPLIKFRENDLGHYLFVRARKVGPPGEGLPDFLYAAYPPERLKPAP